MERFYKKEFLCIPRPYWMFYGRRLCADLLTKVLNVGVPITVAHMFLWKIIISSLNFPRINVFPLKVGFFSLIMLIHWWFFSNLFYSSLPERPIIVEGCMCLWAKLKQTFSDQIIYFQWMSALLWVTIFIIWYIETTESQSWTFIPSKIK